MNAVLPPGLPIPTPEPDGLSKPYWDGLREGRIMVQKCDGCGALQWGPEWICHKCHSFDLGWTAIEGKGTVYSWERVWHPVHPALKTGVPYVALLVELPGAGNIRMLGNLVNDPGGPIPIGAAAEAVFEHHKDADPPFTLLQWRLI